MKARVPNPNFSFLSNNELAELELESAYESSAREALDREEELKVRREAAQAREKSKRID